MLSNNSLWDSKLHLVNDMELNADDICVFFEKQAGASAKNKITKRKKYVIYCFVIFNNE